MKEFLTSFTLASLVAIPVGLRVAQAQSPQEYLDRAADAVLALKSAQFRLERQGGPAVLDEKTGLTFTAADCSYAAPDRVSCNVRVALKNGSILQITRVWTPEGVFQNNPLTQQFARLPGGSDFNGVGLFARTGVPEIMRIGVQQPRIVNSAEPIDGRETIHLTGTVRGERLSPLIGGTVDPTRTYPTDLWVEADSFNVVQLRVSEPNDDGWLIKLFAVNEPVEIPTPQVPAAAPAQPGQ